MDKNNTYSRQSDLPVNKADEKKTNFGKDTESRKNDKSFAEKEKVSGMNSEMNKPEQKMPNKSYGDKNLHESIKSEDNTDKVPDTRERSTGRSETIDKHMNPKFSEKGTTEHFQTDVQAARRDNMNDEFMNPDTIRSNE